MSNESTNQNALEPAAALADTLAVKLARAAAFAHCTQHSYLPQTHEQANSWQPHEWVVAAIHTAALIASHPVGATVKNSLTVGGGQAVGQEPAFYLGASDWGHIRIPMTKHRDVRALRHGFDHGDTTLVPFYAAPPAQAVDLWQPIEMAPKNGSSMLLGYVNSAGNWRTVRGRWFSAEKIEMEWENADDFKAGWYEESVEADDIPNVWPTTPTHWQPLPAAPLIESKAAAGEPNTALNRLTGMAQAVDPTLCQDAARWRAIAPHLQVEWDEDELLKRWTWIDFKRDALSVPTRSRESYASLNEAMDAVIDSQSTGGSQ